MRTSSRLSRNRETGLAHGRPSESRVQGLADAVGALGEARALGTATREFPVAPSQRLSSLSLTQSPGARS